MDTTIFFKTANGSYYLYDMKQSMLLNSHPILEEIHSYKNDPNIKELRKKLVNKFPDYPSDEIEYYLKKYNFLNSTGFFQPMNTEEALSGIITPEIVNSNIANLDNILFQVTGSCNLSCKYCCYGEMYTDNTSNQPMQRDIVDKVLTFMHPHWMSSKNLSYNNPVMIGFYGGEPLLNFDLVEYIVSCCEEMENEEIRFIYSMTTNGVLLDKYMHFLAEKNVSLLISLDGDKEHSQLRVFKNGKESFGKIFANIKSLQAGYPEYFNEKVNFNSVLNKFSNTEDVHSFIKREFGKVPLMDTISVHQLDIQSAESFKELYQPYVESDELIKERMNQSSVFLDLSFFFYYLLNNSYKHYAEMIYGTSKMRKKLPTGTCLPFYKKMFVTSDGNLLACERVGLQYILGTVTDSVYINYDEVAEMYTKYFSNIKKQCSDCYAMGSCGQCLFQLPLKENGLHQCPDQHDGKSYGIFLGNLFGKLEKMPELFDNINKMVSA